MDEHDEHSAVDDSLSRSGSADNSDAEVDYTEYHSGMDDDDGSDGDDASSHAARDEDENGDEASTSAAAALSFGEALLNDIKTTHIARDDQQQHSSSSGGGVPKDKARECCVCSARAIYTCPGCGRRTCSIICVRVHKKDFSCTGERDVAVKIPLSEFSDQQLERDFHFLESCRRAVDNVERSFPRASWRYTFKALPPPLHALREAARHRGVICQITSEGMRKRDVNTSRLDRKSNTIIWRCEFHFVSSAHPEEGVMIGTNWGSERHRLGDIMRYCWATNPTLLCYHINRQYNRASKYVGSTTAAAAAAAAATTTTTDTPADTAACAPANTEAPQAAEDAEGAGKKEEGEEEKNTIATSFPPAERAADTTNAAAVAEEVAEATPELVQLVAFEEEPPLPPIEPVSAEEAAQQQFVDGFLHEERYVILSKAERLGTEVKYFQLNPYETLNETMRRLFFVNEFPVFVVVHTSLLSRFPLVTEEDKEKIRASFRSRKVQEPREKREPRKRSELTADEQERFAKVPCRRFLNGRCVLKEECPYWHCTPEEIPVCRSFMRTGQCDKGVRCSFRHDPEAVRIARKRQREEGGGRGGGGGGGGGFRGSGARGRGGRGGGRSGGRGGGFRGGPRRRLD